MYPVLRGINPRKFQVVHGFCVNFLCSKALSLHVPINYYKIDFIHSLTETDGLKLRPGGKVLLILFHGTLPKHCYKHNDKYSHCSSWFSSVGRASGSQIFWEHGFESWQLHLCNSMWGQDWLHTSCQKVGKCSTRGGSWGTYITFAAHSGFETQRRCHQKSKTGVPVAPKRTCVRQKL